MNTKKTKIISRFFSLRMLTYLATVLLILIDWTRGSQAGEVWRWTVNMTGVLITVLVMGVWGFSGFRRKRYLVWACCGPVMLTVTYYVWYTHQTVGYRDQILSAVAGIWALGFLYIRLFHEVFVEKCMRLRFDLTQVLLLLMLLFAFISVNEDIWPIYFLLIFFPVYQVFADLEAEARHQIRSGILDAVITMFFILQGLAFVFRPFDDVELRYFGLYANPNMNALFYCIIYLAFLLKLNAVKGRLGKVLCFLFAAAMWGFVFLTGCKTAILSMAILSLLYVMIGGVILNREKAGALLGKICVFLVVAVLSIGIDYLPARYLPPVFHHPVWFQGEYSEDKVHSWDPYDSEKYVSFEEYLNNLSDRFGPYLRKLGLIRDVSAASVTEEEPSELSYTDVELSSLQGRVGIWKYYLSHGTLLGHSNTEGHSIFLWWYTWHAQNMFVQFWYYYGIPSAIFFAVWLLSVIIKLGKQTLKTLDHGVFGDLLYFLLFALYGLPEAVWYPGQFILFLAFFLPALSFRGEKNEKGVKTNHDGSYSDHTDEK